MRDRTTRSDRERAWREAGARPRVLALLDTDDWEMRTEAGLLCALLESEFDITLASPEAAGGDRESGLVYALDWSLLERFRDPLSRPRIACVGPLGDLDPAALGDRLAAHASVVQALTSRTARRLVPHFPALVELPRPAAPLVMTCMQPPVATRGVLWIDDPAGLAGELPAGVQRLRAVELPAGGELEQRLGDLQRVDSCVVPANDGAGAELRRACCTGRAIVVAGDLDADLGLVDGREVLVARDARECAGALATLRDDPVLRRRLGVAARVWAESRMSWSAHLRGHRELLQAGLDASPPGGRPQPGEAASSRAVGRGAAAL